MAEPESIVAAIHRFFKQTKEFSGTKVLVTAGPTHESIDPVRFIGNHSSGKMGIAIAAELARRGAEVTLILGPSAEPVPAGISELIRVRSAAEMLDACLSRFPSSSVTVMAAAVADYRPANVHAAKIKKTEQVLEIRLEPTQDILKTLGSLKQSHQILIGFALETDEGIESALKKLDSKNADAIILNSLAEEGVAFGSTTNKITIFQRNGDKASYPLKDKAEVAIDIVNSVKKMLHA
jgi:phosphopantothenoylcysteine decarboxylase/phosphopantothenate--cysteine ligase